MAERRITDSRRLRSHGLRVVLAVGSLASVAACTGGSSASSIDAVTPEPTTTAVPSPEPDASETPLTSTTSTTSTTIPPEPLDPPVRLLPADVDTLLAQDYSTRPPGPYGVEEFEEDFGGANAFGIEQGRAEIRQDSDPIDIDWGDDAPIERYLRITHPEGSFGAGRSGVSFQAKFSDQEDVTAEWLVLLEPGWSWGTGDLRGGKLGGLMLGPKLVSGGRQPDGSANGPGAGGSVRLTWTDDGQMEAYVYHLDQPGEFGEKFTPQMVDGEGVVIDLAADVRPTGEPVEWDVGRWQAVALRVAVNTPGLADGEIDVFKDSERVLSIRGLMWRAEESDWGVSGFMHGFFFGGARDSYAPSSTSHSRIADIKVVSASDEAAEADAAEETE